ncbi:hypothetical protein L2E82_38617 [Cichorium intybus]|uniref:Uncharacterized protein n=1 Tax=Cichorium intybus TaxID=13427 RepID=A0ACB9AFQ5_CICIN|nr:hypothetical protein L2E82_38617 [Cichorium intybus]
MNKRTRKIEETFNLRFDDYYIKKSLHPFPMSSIFPKPAEDAVPITTFDTDFVLLFDPPVRAVDSEARAPDNHESELSKLIDGPDDSSTSSVQRPSSVGGGSHLTKVWEMKVLRGSHQTEVKAQLGEPEIATPNSAATIASDRATTSSTPTHVQGSTL